MLFLFFIKFYFNKSKRVFYFHVVKIGRLYLVLVSCFEINIFKKNIFIVKGSDSLKMVTWDFINIKNTFIYFSL
jgi:hypothetical protein